MAAPVFGEQLGFAPEIAPYVLLADPFPQQPELGLLVSAFAMGLGVEDDEHVFVVESFPNVPLLDFCLVDLTSGWHESVSEKRPPGWVDGEEVGRGRGVTYVEKKP